MITRTDFESLSSRKQRIYAERQYAIVSAMVFAEYREKGVFFDDFGPLMDIHHAWYRSKCPLWYIFQKENLFPVSNRLHYLIHSQAPSDMSPKVREYYDHFQSIAETLKRENSDYES